MTRTPWRLILDQPASRGAWNMAVDEALLEACGRGESLPTLRLYAWDPPCITLGYAQPFSDVDLGRLQTLGWELVRRPTGGRAVLHTDELTYAVMGPLDEPRLAGTVLESYNRLAQALVESLRLINLSVQVNRQAVENARNTNPVCFEVPSTYEITVDGKKLVGSAQARRKDGVLQHGSLPLRGDLARIVEALRFPDQAARRQAAGRLLDHATTVESALGQAVSWEQAAQAIVTAFATSLELEFQPADLTAREKARARQLVELKYGIPDWTRRNQS